MPVQGQAAETSLQLKMENAQLSRAEGSLRTRCSQLLEAVSASEASMRQLEADSIAQQEVLLHQKHQV